MEMLCMFIVILLLFYGEFKLRNNSISGKTLNAIAVIILIAGAISCFSWFGLELKYDCNYSIIDYRPIGCDIKSLSYLGVLNFFFPLVIFLYFRKISNLIRINKVKEEKQIKQKKINNIFSLKKKNFFGKLLVILSVMPIIFRLILSYGMICDNLFEEFVGHESEATELAIIIITPTLGILLSSFATLFKKNDEDSI